MTTPAPTAELSPVVLRAADQIMRVWCKTPGPHWHEDAAMIVVSSGEIRDGLAALPVLEQLKARHAKRSWGGDESGVTVCATCNVGWPCVEASILGVA